jgi:ABC-type multidrug transport system permease subunit
VVREDQPDTSHYRDLPQEFLQSEEGRAMQKLLAEGVYAKQEGLSKGLGSVVPATASADGGASWSPQPETEHDTEKAIPKSAAGDHALDALISSCPLPQPLRPFHVQLWCLLVRDSWAVLRNRRDLVVRFFLSIFMGFVVGTVFFDLGANQSAADQRVSALFVCLLYIMFTANAFLPDLFFARPMYFREVTSGAYTAGPFFLSRLLAQLPWICLELFPLAIMVHFLSSLNSERHDIPLAWLYFCFVLTRYTSLTATYFIGALFAQPNNANTLHATYFNLLFAFTGYFVRGPSIPTAWEWFYHINYLRWSLDFLSANELRHRVFTCAADNYVLADASTFDRGMCPAGISSVTTVGAVQSGQAPFASIPAGAGPDVLNNPSLYLKCPFACGPDELEQYGIGYSDSDMAQSLGLVAVIGAVFAIAGFFVIKYVNHVSR